MGTVFKLCEYLIIKNGDDFKWLQPIDGIYLKGSCVLLEQIDTLALLPYEEVVEYNIEDDVKNWGLTKYYALLSDSGNITFYYVENGEKVEGYEEKLLRERLGCTTKYLNG